MANLSKIKREKMLEYLEKLKEKNSDDENVRAITEIQNALNEKKYGLVWEEHSEKVDEMLEHNIPIFAEDEERRIIVDEKLPYNFLLEGDNLHSLKLLEKTHKGKIDVIYIDPPYNTGEKDFIYDDVFIDQDDSYRHSKWLSFMSERLIIARNLLSIEGAIFISIGDDELYQLMALLNEVFGDENYINLVSVKTKNAAGVSGGGEDKKLKKNLEYLLIFAKDINRLEKFDTVYKLTEIEELLNYYSDNNISWKYTSVLIYEGEKEYIGSTKDGSGEEIKIYKRINPIFKSIGQIIREENISVGEVYKKYFNKIHMTAMPQSSIRPRVMNYVGTENLDSKSLYSIEYIPISGRNKGKLYEQFYKGQKMRLIAWFSDVGILNDIGVFKKDIEGTYWDGIELNNLSKEGNVVFANGKKPVNLVARIISMMNCKNATVLDFFAGSGTTGHAVMQLNKEDGGKRQYILCTNNENNICEAVTYQRLKNIQGELPHNLKYYKTDFIPKFDETEQSVSEKMMKHIRELIELEHAFALDGKKYIILEDEDKLDEIISNIENNGKLFVRSGLFLSRKNQRILEKKGVSVIDIPEYYFRDELKEAGEL